MFVVYNTKTTMEVKRYKQAGRAAKFAMRLNSQAQSFEDIYAVTDIYDYLTNVVKKVTRTNMMTGKEYQEDSNTPSYMSPSSEAYWSM